MQMASACMMRPLARSPNLCGSAALVLLAGSSSLRLAPRAADFQPDFCTQVLKEQGRDWKKEEVERETKVAKR